MIIYTFYVDDQLFASSQNQYIGSLLEPKASLKVNEAGSLEFVVLPDNSHYDDFHKMKSVVRVEEDGAVIFRGRVTDVKDDFYKQRTLYCEGDLGFLSDSEMSPEEIKNYTIAQFFTKLVNNHNSQVDAFKTFTVGNVTVPNASTTQHDFTITTYTDTMNVIDTHLLQEFGGIIRTRTENGVTYLDYLADPIDSPNSFPLSDQEINFGSNLLEFTKEYPLSNIFTVLRPLGSNGLTIESVNDGSPFLENQTAISSFGRIVRSEQWSDITDATALKTKGQEFLDSHTIVYPDDLKIKAIDLKHLGLSNVTFKMLDKVRIISSPHNINVTLYCLSIEYSFLNPENNEYKIGSFVRADDHSSAGGLVSRSGGTYSGTLSSQAANNKWEQFVRLNETANQLEVIAKNLKISSDKIDVNTHDISILAQSVESTVRTVNGLTIQVQANTQGLTTKVSNGEIASTLNMTPQSVLIQANKINLEGYVTATELTTNYLTANQISSNYVSNNQLETNYLTSAQIASQYATLNTLSTNYLTASQIAAQYATINQLMTNYLTAAQIQASYLTANQISSSYASFNYVDSQLATVVNGYSQTFDTSNLYVSSNAYITGNLNVSGRNASWKTKQVVTEVYGTNRTFLNDSYSPETRYFLYGADRETIYYLGR